MGSDAVNFRLDKLHKELFPWNQEDFVLWEGRGSSAPELFRTSDQQPHRGRIL